MEESGENGATGVTPLQSNAGGTIHHLRTCYCAGASVPASLHLDNATLAVPDPSSLDIAPRHGK